MVIDLIQKLPGLLWRHRRSLLAGALIAPIVVTGSHQYLAINAAGLGIVGYAVLRALGTRH